MSENEEQIKHLKQEVSETQAEALLYRQKLQDCYEAARLAIQKNNLAAFFEFIPLPGLNVPATEEARTWAGDFMHACKIDTRALGTATASLERIQALASQLSNEGNNENLKQEILAETRRGLDAHV